MNRLVSLDKKEKNKISNLPSCYFNCCYQSKTSFVFVLFFVKKKKKAHTDSENSSVDSDDLG